MDLNHVLDSVQSPWAQVGGALLAEAILRAVPTARARSLLAPLKHLCAAVGIICIAASVVLDKAIKTGNAIKPSQGE